MSDHASTTSAGLANAGDVSARRPSRRRWPRPRGPRRRLMLAIAAALGLLVTPAAVLAATGFADVPEGSTHEPGIQWAVDNGITVGCAEQGNYCPEEAVSRAQMATFLHRASGNDPATPPSVNADKVDGFDAAELMAGGGGEGPAGPPGPAGPAGLANVEVVTESRENASPGGFETANCPAGKTLIAGGGGVNNIAYHLVESRPLAGIEGWFVYAASAAAGGTTITAYAICASVG